MSANRIWVVECEICKTHREHPGDLTVEQLGEALKAAGWSLPVYGGTFCGRCTKAVKKLGER